MNELRERIVNYIPYDEQEESDKEYILKFIDTFDDVLTRQNEYGHFTRIYLVIFVVRLLLLIRIEVKYL